jgi:hypothetical protein
MFEDKQGKKFSLLFRACQINKVVHKKRVFEMKVKNMIYFLRVASLSENGKVEGCYSQLQECILIYLLKDATHI